MLSWFRALMPKEDRFFDLFEQHAAALVDGAAALRALLDGTQDVPVACRAIAAHSPEEQERREALALTGLLIAVSRRKPKGGAA